MDVLLDFVRDDVIDAPAAYPLILALVALDALLPLIPSEFILVTSALMATQGDLTLWIVFLAGVAGALIGDSLIYLLGSTVGEPAAERVVEHGRARERLHWARRKLRRHGVGLILASRFLPLGRTAASFAAGMLDFPWRRFLAADIVAATLSVGYLMAVGVIGGRAFADSFWPAFGLSAAMVASMILLVAGVRRFVGPRLERRDRAGG